jgi:hypothetical protein
MSGRTRAPLTGIFTDEAVDAPFLYYVVKATGDAGGVQR